MCVCMCLFVCVCACACVCVCVCACVCDIIDNNENLFEIFSFLFVQKQIVNPG